MIIQKKNEKLKITLPDSIDYNEDDADELLLLIRDSFIPAFEKLEKTLYEKINEAEDDL